MIKKNIGNSVLGKPLTIYQLLPQNFKNHLLLLGGVHGDELEGVWLMEEVIQVFQQKFPFKNTAVTIWPRVNADGVEKHERWNANNVDLNRNLPTKDWTPEIKNPRYQPGPKALSEPENQALVKLIDEIKPKAILSAHSFENFQVNVNGEKGVVDEWGERLAKVCYYPVTRDIGYPTPGSLGTYGGTEKQIPTITLEVERDLPKEEVLKLHIPVILMSVEFWETR